MRTIPTVENRRVEIESQLLFTFIKANKILYLRIEIPNRNTENYELVLTLSFPGDFCLAHPKGGGVMWPIRPLQNFFCFTKEEALTSAIVRPLQVQDLVWKENL